MIFTPWYCFQRQFTTKTSAFKLATRCRVLYTGRVLMENLQSGLHNIVLRMVSAFSLAASSSPVEREPEVSESVEMKGCNNIHNFIDSNSTVMDRVCIDLLIDLLITAGLRFLSCVVGRFHEILFYMVARLWTLEKRDTASVGVK